jgi:hypothetical protein
MLGCNGLVCTGRVSMQALLHYIASKAESLRASLRKLPFRSDAGSLVPDEVPLKIEAEPEEKPAELEARVLQILRVAAQLQPGPLRRDALAEVTRLRRRAIELHRRKAAELTARIGPHPESRTGHRWVSEANPADRPSA